MAPETVSAKRIVLDYSGPTAKITEKTGMVTLREGPLGMKLPVGVSLFGHMVNHWDGAVVFDEDIARERKQEFSRKGAGTLLNYAIWHDDSVGDLAFSVAMEKFRGLAPDAQATLIRKMEAELDYHSKLPSGSIARARGARVISDFFAEAAGTLRRDDAGVPDTSACRFAVGFLETVLRDGSGAAPAAGLALWNLKYLSLGTGLAPGVDGMRRLSGHGYPACGSSDFWKALLHDDTSRPAAVEKLLEAGPTADIQKHGWDALRLQISVVGRDIAASKSEKKTQFLLQLASDSDPQMATAALWSAIYLDKTPDEFKHAAEAMASFHARRMAELSIALEKARAASAYLWRLDRPESAEWTVRPNAKDLASLEETAAQLKPLSCELVEASVHLATANEFQMILACKHALESNDEKRFEAIPQITGLYLIGRPQLAPLVRGLSQEVSKILEAMPTEGSRTIYYEKAALAFAELLIATNPANGNGARARMLETLTGMLDCEDERRFHAANTLIRLGAEIAARSGIRLTTPAEKTLFLIRGDKGDHAPLRKELAEIAQAMVAEATGSTNTTRPTRAVPSPEDRENAARTLELLLIPCIPVQVLTPGTDPQINHLSTAWVNGIPLPSMMAEAQLPKEILQNAAIRSGISPKMEVSVSPINEQKRSIRFENGPAVRALPPGVKLSKRDAFRLHMPLDSSRGSGQIRVLTPTARQPKKVLQPADLPDSELLKELGEARDLTPRWQDAISQIADRSAATESKRLLSEIETLWRKELNGLRLALAAKDDTRIETASRRITYMHYALVKAGTHGEGRIGVLEIIKLPPLKEEKKVKPPAPMPAIAEMHAPVAPVVARKGLIGLWDRYSAWMDKFLNTTLPSR